MRLRTSFISESLDRIPKQRPETKVMISIFELAEMDDASVLSAVNATLERHPLLRRLYEEPFIAALIPDRRNLNNYLLLLLVQPPDTYAERFWNLVVADMLLLEPEGSFQHFPDKLRMREQQPVESASVELELAARNKRKGFAIELEPTIPGTSRRCEFRAESRPETWWEVKTVLDLDYLREDAQAYVEVARRLRSIPEPYVLNIEHCALTPPDAATAVRQIRGEIRDHYRSDGALPAVFESRGLVVEAACRTKKSFGYLGSSVTDLYKFGSENIERVLDKICSAISQLPAGKAGVVVIDTSRSHWIGDDDVQEACYGELSLRVERTWEGPKVTNVRSSNAVFKPGAQTRVSAVVWYSRRDSGTALETTMIAYHNPYAAVPLPPEILRSAGLKQIRQVETGNGRCMLETFDEA